MTILAKLNKKHTYFLLLFILLSSFTFNVSSVKAQADEEEYYEEEEEVYEDEEMPEEELLEEEIIEDENLGEEYNKGSDLYENTVGIEDTDGMYKLDDLTASTFKQITNMERENAIMKLKIEQGKLKLDLKKQEAEKKKLALNLAEEEKNRELRREEQERKLEEARKKARAAEEKEAEEKKKKQQEEELNRKIMEKLNATDLNNPDDVQALTQLLALAGGNTEGLNKNLPARKNDELEDKYLIKSIAGAGGNLVANVENIAKKSTFKIRNGSILDGWLVESIKSSSILLKKNGLSKVMYLNQ